MEVFYKTELLQHRLKQENLKNKQIGFVPTMGALHEGHISLVERSVKENEFTVSSIFVNPAQFNDPKDLIAYPRTPENDLQLLESHGCDLIFMPSVQEIYPGKIDLLEIPLGKLETVMEGAIRHGHFKGMVTIVHKLFSLINPTRAYFGEKDYQQLAIIRFMVKYLQLKVEIRGCPTVREKDGLAMSSRNIHLSHEERKAASVIYRSMTTGLNDRNKKTPAQIRSQVIQNIEETGYFKVEYFVIVDAETLQEIKNWGEKKELRACIAVKASKTRLIDNVAV